MARTAADKSSKQLSRRIAVLVDIDLTIKTPKVIWEHEKPLLDFMHDGKVTDITAASMDEGYSPRQNRQLMPYNKTQDLVLRPSVANGLGFIFTGDPEAEYDRLQSAYGYAKEEKVFVVEKIYGRFQEGRFSALIGKPELEDLPELQLRSLIREWGLEPDDSHKDMSESEKNAASAARQAYLKADRATLLEMCEAGQVEFA